MAVDVFKYDDYKAYLVDLIEERSERQKGIRSRLARAAACQSAYVSQVLNGHNHFSLEQAEAIGSYLGLSEDELDFFLLLVQIARAGTPSLTKRLSAKKAKAREARLSLKNRLKETADVSASDTARYFTHWDIAAVHALISIPDYLTVPAIAGRLKLPVERVREILEFLESTGQVRRDGDRYEYGVARMHFGTDSPVLPLHHTNWRLQAIRSMNRDLSQDTHYTSVMTLSEKDVAEVKEKWVEFVLELHERNKKTDPEDLHSLTFDFFRV